MRKKMYTSGLVAIIGKLLELGLWNSHENR